MSKYCPDCGVNTTTYSDWRSRTWRYCDNQYCDSYGGHTHADGQTDVSQLAPGPDVHKLKLRAKEKKNGRKSSI